jgi:hypothetical protein
MRLLAILKGTAVPLPIAKPLIPYCNSHSSAEVLSQLILTVFPLIKLLTLKNVGALHSSGAGISNAGSMDSSSPVHEIRKNKQNKENRRLDFIYFISFFISFQI